MHNHKHSCVCEHERVKFCKHCNTVYCLDCAQEWYKNYSWTLGTYTQPTWTYGDWYSTGTATGDFKPNYSTTTCSHA